MSVVQSTGIAGVKVGAGEHQYVKLAKSVASQCVTRGTFRFEALRELQKDEDLMKRIGVYLSCGARTEALAGLRSDWTDCMCLLHRIMPIEVQGGVGCEALGPGYHSAIKGLYGAGHTACVVEPGVRVRDMELFMLVEFPAGKYVPVRKKYIAGRGARPEAMGPYYCYTRAFPGEVVVRVSRILGPEPEAHRVLRWFLRIGRRDVMHLAVDVLPNNKLHLRDELGSGMTPLAFVHELLKHPPGARIGTDPHVFVDGHIDMDGRDDLWLIPSGGYLPPKEMVRFRLFVDWCEDLSIDVVDNQAVDYCVATRPQSDNAISQDFVHRAKLFEHLGDRALSYLATRHELYSGGTAAGAAAWHASYSNEKLAALVASDVAGIGGLLCTGNLSPTSKAIANLVEGLIGFVAAFRGIHAARRVITRLGLLPDWTTPDGGVKFVFPEPTEESELAHIEAMLQDYRIRGGDTSALRERIEASLAHVGK